MQEDWLNQQRDDRANVHSRTSLPPKSGHWGEGVTAEEMADYVWLRPEIEAEMKFAESAKGGLLRHAEFVGLREA